MRAPLPLFLCALLGAQGEYRTRDFLLDLPPGWRQATPDDARALRRTQPRIPAELISISLTAPEHPFGDVDRWLQGQFDGRALLARIEPQAISANDEGLATLQALWTRQSNDRVRLRSAALTHVGRDRHPAIECVVELDFHERGTFAVRQLYALSGRRTVMLACWARADDQGAVAAFAPVLASLRFARPPGESQSFWNTLLYTGLVVGLLAIAIQFARRGTSSRA
jgi:hypothetical protein